MNETKQQFGGLTLFTFSRLFWLLHNVTLTCNRFESILHNENDKPWYIGHLYLPEGSANMRKNPPTNNNDNRPYQLKTWEEEIADNSKENTDHDTQSRSRSAVVGTLMRIADYRRMQDGRLLVLVEAMERFVVTNVKQEVPYSIADVQLLPDTEEVDPDFCWVAGSTEGDVRDARSLALQESFVRYHPYEYDEAFKLPIDKKNDLQTTDIHGSLLTLVVPYVPLSKTADLAQLNNRPLDFDKMDARNDDETEAREMTVEIWDDQQHHNAHVSDEQPCLEHQLLQGGIFKDFKHPDESVMNLSFEELEYRVWMEINNFLKSTKTPVSPALLGLLPPNVEWPTNFYLRKIADDIASRTDLKHNFVPVSPLLPLHRRLRRLSYSVTTLVENKPGMDQLRQQLLETPSTRARLALILETLEDYNSVSVWGEFE
jgi:ATP-dependent protease La (LON) substrate-binding domain